MYSFWAVCQQLMPVWVWMKHFSESQPLGRAFTRILLKQQGAWHVIVSFAKIAWRIKLQLPVKIKPCCITLILLSDWFCLHIFMIYIIKCNGNTSTMYRHLMVTGRVKSLRKLVKSHRSSHQNRSCHHDNICRCENPVFSVQKPCCCISVAECVSLLKDPNLQRHTKHPLNFSRVPPHIMFRLNIHFIHQIQFPSLLLMSSLTILLLGLWEIQLNLHCRVTGFYLILVLSVAVYTFLPPCHPSACCIKQGPK